MLRISRQPGRNAPFGGSVWLLLAVQQHTVELNFFQSFFPARVVVSDRRKDIRHADRLIGISI